MKKILLMCILILGISCTTNETDLQEETKTELSAKLPNLGEGSWYTYEKINGVEYTVINGIKAKEIIAIADGSCKTCRANCSYGSNLGGGVHLVHCDNGNSYYAQNCGYGWTVIVAYGIDSSTPHGSQHLSPPPPPC